MPRVWDDPRRLRSSTFKRAGKLFSDTIKRWRRAFVYFGPALNQRLRPEARTPRIRLAPPAPRGRHGTRGLCPPRPGSPRPPRPSRPPPPATPRARGRRERGGRRERARRHKAEPERKGWRGRPGRPGRTHLRGAPSRGGRRERSLPTLPLRPRGPASAARPGQGVAAAPAPQSVLGEPARAGRTRGRSAAARL